VREAPRLGSCWTRKEKVASTLAWVEKGPTLTFLTVSWFSREYCGLGMQP